MKQKIKEERLSTDILVVGGGMAGLFAAIKARLQGYDVILVDKGFVGRCGGTHYAEGDIQFFRPSRKHVMKDWLDKNSRDTEYINNRDWNEIILAESEDRYNDLVEWGIEFYKVDGELVVEGPHLVNNIPKMYEIICMKNREYAPTLRSKALKEGVRVFDRMMTCELLKQDGRVVGAMAFNTTSGKLYTIKAKATILATGASTAYKVRVMNTDYWTGDGICMAYRAGAQISGMEFRQSTGGTMYNAYQERLQMYTGGELQGKKVDLQAKYPHLTLQSGWVWPQVTATNEPITWWGASEIHQGKGPLYHDMDNYSEKVRNHHISYFKRVGDAEHRKLGLDYFNGGKLQYSSGRQELNTAVGGAGIWAVDKYCTSTIPGLYGAGGCCATMTSGAKYGGMGLGLNGGMVTGTRAATGAMEYISKLEDFELDEDMVAAVRKEVTAPAVRISGHSPAWLTQALQGLMVPYYVLIYRHAKRMNAALTMVQFLKDEVAPNMMAADPHDWRLAYETKNMIQCAELQLLAALYRTESRGSHFREDYPERNDKEWLVWVLMQNVDGQVVYTKEPIPERFWPDYTKPYEQIYPLVLPKLAKKTTED